jgi:outer membrane lipoprotein-sorting protein
MVGGLTAAFLLAAIPAGAASGPAELYALEASWAKVNDYQTTIVANEYVGATTQERKFHFSFLRPEHVKAEIMDGPMRGMIAIWNGGDKVVVFHRGIISGVRVPFGLHDRMVTSPRGNTVASADFEAELDCFAAHPDLVRVHDGPQLDGDDTIELVMESVTPLECTGYSEHDYATITRDVLIVNAQTSLPMRRMRYEGDTLVEQWEIRNLRVNTGLTLTDFR